MSSSSRAGVNQRRGFLPKDLKKMLESYGALCRFRAAMRPEVQKLTDDNTQASFLIEHQHMQIFLSISFFVVGKK